MSKDMEQYFRTIQERVNECYEIATNAREQGLDPELYVESPQAKDLAGRVEKLVGPDGVAEIIRNYKKKGKNEDEIVFQVVSDILDRKVGNIDSLNDRVERAIRVGLAIKTMGVVSAPLEGISKIKVREDQSGNKYLSLYFAGPIRAAGGTVQALCVLIADYVRRKTHIPKYEATEAEIGRYVEEVKLYDRKIHLQYPSSNDELRFAVKNLPIEINGDSTEDEEVSAFRNLPRVETNKIRGGACLVLNDGILSKASKLMKITKNMNLEGWDWLLDLKKIALKEEESQEKEQSMPEKIPPNPKFVADIIAGRPVFSHPSRIGGHRIRYGKSRNTGLAAGGMHPATMAILDDFVAIGTQLRIERPGKSTSICPVDAIEPPIVKLKNGNVVRVTDYITGRRSFPEIEEILFLGDILFGFGEFAENNHKLVPSGYVEEWWSLELESSIKDNDSNSDVLKYIENPFQNIPTASEAIRISKIFRIPLHPAYTDFWGNLTVEEIKKLRKAFLSNYIKSSGKIALDNEDSIKKILEKAFVPHKVKEGKINFSKAMNFIYTAIFNLNDEVIISQEGETDVFSYFLTLSSIQVKNKAPYFMGTRMGRPEKSERKSMKGVHSLFPLSDKVGSSRLFEKAIELRLEDSDGDKGKKKNELRKKKEELPNRIVIDVARKQCPKCDYVSIFNNCPKCGTFTELKKICPKCRTKNKTYLFQVNLHECPQCSERLSTSLEARFNLKNHIFSKLKSLKLRMPENFKGIIGLTNEFKVPEPIEKGILRAKNGVLVYKTAEIRYDATDIPLTHFKPNEISVSVKKLNELGYNKAYDGKTLENGNQIVELKVQDIVLSDDCAEYLLKVAKFIDDELEYFYKLEPFYKVSVRDDLVGHLVVGLAPHTSAGIIGRIIGFSPARSIYAHPFWHAAKRRNCDGDEDGVMLLLDPLLNFSRFYLPSKIGGRMDATLVISTLLDPNEIDAEAHNVDTLFKYPLEFYEATQKYSQPSEIDNIMGIIKNHLGTPEQYQSGFNIPTENINEGPTKTAYKTYESMDDKITAQLHLAKIINAVDSKNVAKKILSTHFTPDIAGNLRKFSVQSFRCIKCNSKFRRPPISNGNKCPRCGNRIILTVNRGGIEKYIKRAIILCTQFNLDQYTLQRMELINEYVQSLTNNPKIKQQKLSDFF
ncbi:MAG: DNA polymerase II large subunit [Candidatus Lokiarchaeota archaeon]|nr:DNA polymerase II large subunit [Candidatus Lokiarchaeota archaeon]